MVFVYQNEQFKLLQYSPSALQLFDVDAKTMFSLESDRRQLIDELMAALDRSIQSLEPFRHQFCYVIDNISLHFNILISHLVDISGNHTFNVRIDQNEDNVILERQQHLRHELLIHNAHDCMLVIDQESKIQIFNKAAQTLFGYELHEVLGHGIEKLLPENARYNHSDHVKKFGKSSELSREMSSRSVVYGLRKNSEVFPAEISISKLNYDDRIEFLAVVRDISVRAKLLEKLNHQAHTDALTGLHNRLSIETKLASYISHASDNLMPLCLMLIDLDYFKQINDNYGHDMGDKVLCSFAVTAHDAIAVEHIFGRYGGEEFIVIVPNKGLETVREQAALVCNACEADRVNSVRYTVSIGVVEYQQGELLPKFIQRVDSALYNAKDSGRNRVCSR